MLCCQPLAWNWTRDPRRVSAAVCESSPQSVARHLGIFWSAFLLSTLATEADRARANEVVQLLNRAWGTTREERALGDELFAKARAGKTPVEATWARALVLTKQRRYAEAERVLATYLAEHPDALAARQLTVWLLLVAKKPAEAMTEMEQVTNRLAQQRDHDANLATRLANWLGRAFGVVDGPLAPRVQAARRDEQLARLMAGLNADEQQQFEQGYANVLAEFGGRLNQRTAIEQQEQEADAQQRAARQEQLNEKLGQISGQLGDLRQQMRDVEDHYAATRRDVASQAPPLLNDLAQVDASDRVLSWRLADLQAAIAALERQIADEDDPVRRAQLIQQKDALAFQLQWDAIRWGDNSAARYGVESGLGRVQGELAVVDQTAANERGALHQRGQRLLQAERSAERQKERLAKPRRRPSGRIRSMQQSAQAVTTYLQFPLDEERQLLLHRLDPPN